tara:strand:- start:12861 stop:13460 length:600 start_codon:yes stop_codon:yes gene_type:complete
MIIGLTGGIGSGKSTVAKMFQNFENVAVYIADVEAKKLMNSSEIIRKNLINAFGEETYKDNLLNRTYLASIVFKNKEKLQILNSIVHPEVKRHFQEYIKLNATKTYVIYESAILFESNTQNQFNFIISVFVTLEERVKRVLKRDKSTRDEVLSRIKSQWKEDKKLLLSNYIINNHTLKETEVSVKNIHNILTQKATTIL